MKILQKLDEWVTAHKNEIKSEYPDSQPMIYFFWEYASQISTISEFTILLRDAVRGVGYNNFISGYLLMNDCLDEGDVLNGVEFYFNDALDGEVPFKTFAHVLHKVALAYSELYPETKEDIMHYLPLLRKVYGI